MKKLFFVFIALMLSTLTIKAQWGQAATGVTNARDLSVVNDNVAWVSDPSSPTFALTTDGGKTWITKNYPSTLYNSNVNHGALSAVSATTAYIVLANAGVDNGIYITTNSGDTWQKQSTGFNQNSPFPDFVYFWDAKNGVAVGDASPNEYFEIYTTNNGGVQWNAVPVENMPSGNSGWTFSDRADAFRVHGDTIYFFATGGSSDNRIFKSTNKGLNWTVKNTNFYNSFSFDFKDNNNGLLVFNGNNNSNNNTVYTTIDAGENWTQVNNLWVNSFWVNYLPAQHAYFSIGNWFNYTNDNGQTWKTHPSFQGLYLQGIGYSSSGKIFMSRKGYVYYSNNFSGINLAITKTQITSSRNIDVTFSADVDLLTAQDSANYRVSFSQNNVTKKIKIQATRDNSNHALVHLATTTNLPCGYIISTAARNVKDLTGFGVINGSAPDSSTCIYTLPLTVSENSLHMAALTNSKATFDITTTSNWNISSLSPWIKADVIEGTGNAKITVTGDFNYTSDIRIGTIVISENTVPMQTVTVTQSGSTSISGNYIVVTRSADSVAGSLRDAISKANSGDIIIFDKNLTEVKLGTHITFSKSLSIYGNPNLVIHDNQYGSSPTVYRLFDINGSNSIVVNFNNIKFAKKHQMIVDTTLDMNGKIILVENGNAKVNFDFCYFVTEDNSYGGRINCFYTPNGSVKKVNGQNGGAIAQYGGIINISNCTFSKLYCGNQSYYGAGGAICQFGGLMNLVNCTFYNNSAGVNSCSHTIGIGSAIYSRKSSMDITNCTFYGHENSNTYNLIYPEIGYIKSATKTIVLDSSNVAIKNTVFYANGGSDFNGSIQSGGYNIFDQGSVSGAVATDLFSCNPAFKKDVLLDNSTFWLPVCAIDSIGCAVNALHGNGNGAPTFDQRGFIRSGAPDIGAYEMNGIAPLLSVTNNNLTIAAAANSTKTFDINTNVYWTIEGDQNWLKPNISFGTGNSTIILTAEANPNITSRVAVITVYGRGVAPYTITVTQNALTTGLTDIDNSMIMFPNPVTKELTIKNISLKATISIFDVKGKLVFNKIAESTNEIIDLRNLIEGVYIIRVTDYNATKTRKLIKQ